eukprot:289483-Prymnesium_polylepis.1
MSQQTTIFFNTALADRSESDAHTRARAHRPSHSAPPHITPQSVLRPLLQTSKTRHSDRTLDTDMRANDDAAAASAALAEIPRCGNAMKTNVAGCASERRARL